MLNLQLITSFMGENLYNTINNEVTFQEIVRMGANSPSVMSNQCDITDDGVYPLYRHPVDEEPKVYNWSKTILAIKNKIQEELKVPVNHCLIRKYRDGNDFIREHSDKIIDISPNTPIINYSCGAARTMYFRNKKTRQVTKLILPPDSLLIMDYKTNLEYFHSIKKHSSILEPRISCTFRVIDTFKHPDGKITGKGEEFQDFISHELLEHYKVQNWTDQSNK